MKKILASVLLTFALILGAAPPASAVSWRWLAPPSDRQVSLFAACKRGEIGPRVQTNPVGPRRASCYGWLSYEPRKTYGPAFRR